MQIRSKKEEEKDLLFLLEFFLSAKNTKEERHLKA